MFDLNFTNSDHMNIAKIFFCNWNPDSAPIRVRVAYATAKENFRSHLDLNGKEITLNSAEDVLYCSYRSPKPILSRSSISEVVMIISYENYLNGEGHFSIFLRIEFIAQFYWRD